MTDADWLAAVAAAPDDPLVRLAYADWLDDRSDPRAELLRLDVELAGRADDDPVARPLVDRLAELAPGVDARWRAAVCQVPLWCHGWADGGGCLCVLPGDAPGMGLIEYEPPGYHTLVRQPTGRAELAALCVAARGCTGRQVRYYGSDPVVIRMLGNDPAVCEHVIAAGVAALVRADRPPDPRGVAYVAAAYERPEPGRGDTVETVIVLVCRWLAVGILVLFIGLWLLVAAAQLLNALFAA